MVKIISKGVVDLPVPRRYQIEQVWVLLGLAKDNRQAKEIVLSSQIIISYMKKTIFQFLKGALKIIHRRNIKI
jgi:hypothetical protein